MSDHNDSTAAHSIYGKPNFLGIVIASGIAIIVILVAAYFVLGWDARKLLPHGPNPRPNAMVLSAPGAVAG